MSYKIPFIKPTFPLPDQIAGDLRQIYKNNYYTNNGPYYYRFKQALEDYLGKDLHVAVTTNATLALMLAVKALMPQGRKKVLIPAFTFAAGGQAILWAGFEPVFIDINQEDLQPNIEQATQYIKDRLHVIAGILLCNSFGTSNSQVNEWQELASKYSLPLVIDSAAGFGSRHPNGSPLGGLGNCEIFSLHATKPFGIGEGGVIVSRDKNFIDQMERNKNFGFNEKRETVELGLNAKVTELHCAIGLRVLSSLDSRLISRRNKLKQYKELLTPLGVEFQSNDELSTVAFVSSILPKQVTQEDLQTRFERSGIEVRFYYNPPLHKHTIFRDVERLDLTITEDICSRIVSLPMSDELTNKEIKEVTEVISGYIRRS